MKTNKSLPSGTSLLITEHPTLQAKGRLFFCKGCGELKEIRAKGLCNQCYYKKWRLENPDYYRKYQKENPEKANIANKKWQKENPEKVKAIRRKRYLENSEKIKAVSRKRRKENPDYYRKWQKANPGKCKMANRKWQKANPRQVGVIVKKWQKKNPGKMREISLKRRGYGIPEKGIINKIIIENILKYGSIVCEKCKEKCPDGYHIDHIVPLSKGGSNDYDNLQILCAHCNRSKYTDIGDYRQDSKDNQMFLKITKGEKR